MTPAPEQEARQKIDQLLDVAGWVVQDVKAANIHAGRGVALREFPLPGYGFADYLLYVDGRAAGVIEAKKAGVTLTGVEIQSARYKKGLPAGLPAWLKPLPSPTSPPASRPASPTALIRIPARTTSLTSSALNPSFLGLIGLFPGGLLFAANPSWLFKD
jgi:type I restriction enzyme R subunit